MKKLIIMLFVLAITPSFAFGQVINGEDAGLNNMNALADTLTDVHEAIKIMESAVEDTLTDIHTNMYTALEDVETNITGDIAGVQATVDDIEADEHATSELFSRKAVQTATSFADSSANAFYSFIITSAADSTFGAAVQLLGTDDTPINMGNECRRSFSRGKVY